MTYVGCKARAKADCLCDAPSGNQYYVDKAIACLNKVFTYLPTSYDTKFYIPSRRMHL